MGYHVLIPSKNECCFSGHRQIDPAVLPRLQKLLQAEIIAQYRKGVRRFNAGGAIGFDTMAAQAVLSLREKCPGMSLVLVLPCEDQDHLWNREEQQTYLDILLKADEVHYITRSYRKGCMYERNRSLVDRSDRCVCYDVHTGRGTKYTLDYCKKQGVPVINLAEKL